MRVRRLGKPGGARGDLAGKRFLRGVLQRLGLRSARGGVGQKHKSIETADHMAFDDDFAGFVDLRLKLGVLAQPPHQHAGAAIDEALGEPLVQRVGELVFDGACDALPMLGIGEPIRPVGGKGPGADMGDARRQRIDVAVGPVGLRDLTREPVGLDFALAHEEAIDGDHELGVVRRRDLAIIGNLADVPQPLDVGARSGHGAHLVVARGVVEHENIFGDRSAGERAFRRRRRQRRLQGADRGEVEIGVAPLHELHRLECVRFERLGEFGLERRAAAGGAERAVAGGAAGAAGDLRQFGRG